MRLVKWVGTATAVLVIGSALIVANGLRSMHALRLQSCMEERVFPGAAWACSQALFRFHPTTAEVAEMNSVAGASWALTMGDDAQVRRLLQHYVRSGVELDAVDRRMPGANWTALHLAASSSDLRGVRLLLEAGASAQVQDLKGRTPLDLAHQRAASTTPGRHDAEIAQALRSAMSISSAAPPRSAPGASGS
jgi:hypothetical protein